MRIGFGYDVHRYKEGRPFVLGGVRIECAYGPDGHSDADVLLHAVIDAILGAAGLGDIGRHFPPTDNTYKDISSLVLLEKTIAEIKKKKLKVHNIDSTVVCEEPKLLPYIDRIRETIAKAVGCSAEMVNVKGKTEEGLGFTGSKLGIKAYAVVLLVDNA
ncbi:MAG: 2-C-methyl-D-erythritol 2,4-cyclodiphosphate synthase [Deltaproteobacteria bacterium]|nr:2-C-methyl-D-erythritol 2,4-cyclodiphosphate synthase [Deltaproteobacteria bacterium]